MGRLRAIGRPRRTFVRAGAIRFHARALGPRGEPPEVVLVHGAGVSGRYMAPLLVQLARWYAVAAPDMPGFGGSSSPPRTLDVDGLADALVGWMDAAGVRRATLVGNSMGCQVIAAVAARYPDRVERVVLVGPTMDPAAPSLGRQALRWMRAALVEPPSLLLVLLLEYAQSGLRRFVETIRAGLRDPFAARLRRVGAPALVVRGDRDPIVGQGWAERVAALLPRGRLAVVPGGGHAVNYDSPRALARLIRAFVDSGRARAGDAPGRRTTR